MMHRNHFSFYYCKTGRPLLVGVFRRWVGGDGGARVKGGSARGGYNEGNLVWEKLQSGGHLWE